MAPRPTPPPVRFWGKVLIDDTDKCWEWTGYRKSNGYGSAPIGSRTR